MTRRRAIPSVLRATFANPRPALKPPGFIWYDRCDDMDNLWRVTEGVSTESLSSSAAAGGRIGSWALIVLSGSIAAREGRVRVLVVSRRPKA